jgi:hypothetical protein
MKVLSDWWKIMDFTVLLLRMIMSFGNIFIEFISKIYKETYLQEWGPEIHNDANFIGCTGDSFNSLQVSGTQISKVQYEMSHI